ncbi:MAG: orotidine-5-phosphate decarboxylase [Bacillota bacterium]|nr:orotidine-5-phosphate decarboxylase [Bacillota bacterium]
MEENSEIIVALDTNSPDEAVSLVDRLMPEITMYKVGMELFYSCGAGIIDRLAALGAKIFLDLKLHDIPVTVGRAMAALARPGVDILDVHASGGSRMMKEGLAAVRGAAQARGVRPPKVIGVTLLTSIDREIFSREIAPGCDRNLVEHVVRMARLAKESGLDGVVTSAFEVGAIREACGPNFITVVPGVRPAWAADAHDQRRCMTPRQAVLAGADYLVVGRPITRARSPRDAAARLLDEVREARRDARG